MEHKSKPKENKKTKRENWNLHHV